MAKKNKQENIDKMKNIALDSLHKQKTNVETVLENYKELEDKLGFELFPFIVQANRNLLDTINLQIKIME